MNFIAIDFETADSLHTSPCALGLTLVSDNKIIERQSFLINPERPFSAFCSKIHGITQKDVSNSPTFPIVWSKISGLFEIYPVVAHNAAFDLSVLYKAANRYQIIVPSLSCYCTYKLYKYNYPNLNKYSLSGLCKEFGVELTHNHDCSCDCDAAARLMLLMLGDEKSVIFTEDSQPVDFEAKSRQRQYIVYGPGNSRSLTNCFEEAHTKYDDIDSIHFDGKRFVITGEFAHYERSEISDIITANGGLVSGSVSQKTDYLIVAYQNIKVIKDVESVRSTKL